MVITARHLLCTAALLISVMVVYQGWGREAIVHAPGVLVPEPPQQKNLAPGKLWQQGDFFFTALAVYRIRARVLGVEPYWFGRESEVSPLDFALGWGPMSDQNILDRIKISQHRRWYYWKAETLPLPAAIIPISNSRLILAADRSGFLVDCGGTDIIDELRKLRAAGKLTSVEHVYVTHYHDDHTDALPKLVAEFGAKVHDCGSLIDLIERPGDYRLPCLTKNPTPVTATHRHGETWSWKEYQLTIFDFPGQTLHHNALLVEREGGWVYRFDPRANAARKPVDAWTLLDRIKTPTLIARAELSPVLPRDQASQLAASIAGSTLVEIPGAYHHLTLDRPQAFTKALGEVLGKL
jgi:pimeloyl-ACP methyl ester carboxylesterase